jgi:hypothetical protein
LSGNCHAEKLLSENIELVNISNLCSDNTNVTNIVKLMLEKDPTVIDKLVWDKLSVNPHAHKLLQEYPDKVNWDLIAKNTSAFHLLRDNFDKISETGWNNLIKNPSAKNFLKKNYDKIPQQLKHICHEPLPIDQYETSHE